MAKKLQPSYTEIERSLKVFASQQVPASEVGYKLLMAFGKSQRDIERYKEGKGILKTFDGLLIKGLFCYRPVTATLLTDTLEELKTDTLVMKAAPKIIAVSDGETLIAYDTRERDTYERRLSRMHCDFLFFYPLMDVERIHNVEESPADTKAAEKLAKLHDEIRAYNEYNCDADLHDLNIFISRLLFCFFAEDTGIFAPNLFTNFIKQCTSADGSDLNDMIGCAFRIMDMKAEERPADTLKEINDFPYVNGGLFAKDIPLPVMGRKARKIIVECGELDWKDINPDIFGSMFQAVVNPYERAKEGIHYTSVPNIMKVINPLFMNELREEYNRLFSLYKQKKNLLDMSAINAGQFYAEGKSIIKSCEKLLLRMSRMKFLDPACGSGNFLVITYKQLRLLEMDILRLEQLCTKDQRLNFIDGSVISLTQFYGIELLDFPHETAMLSLWLAEHQMNNKFHADFGVNIAALPLHNINQIVCANACRTDWNEVCPHTKDEEVFVFGNPPYLGARLQDQEQKKDMLTAIGKDLQFSNLDYISTWFYKGTNFIAKNNAKLAFVTTNSICQGEQVPLLWKYIYSKEVEISFAHTSFKWENNAKNNANITVSIVGLSNKSSKDKYLYTDGKIRTAKEINAYLSIGASTIITQRSKPLSDVPELNFGSMANDGGALLLSPAERDSIINLYPDAEAFIHPILGSLELIRGIKKYCIWITDEEKAKAYAIPPIAERIEKCRRNRSESKREATNKLASTPYKFAEIRHRDAMAIIIPRVSSENRKYIPMDILEPDTVISDSAFTLYDAPLHIFGILTSTMHMTWVRAVGGRLETRYRYSAGLCYNTFPFPKVSAEKKKEIEAAAEEVLLVREDFPGKTLADLYDPKKMPPTLKEAHDRLDAIVESCYPGAPFANDEERQECLFKLYEKMTK